MNPASDPSIADTAALWAARLRSGPLTPGQERELGDWLSQSSEHAALLEAYRQESATIDASLLVLKSEGLALETEPVAVSRRPLRRWLLPTAALAATALILLLWPAAEQSYQTAPGQRESVTLADGSRVELSANTTLTARFDRTGRHLTLVSGEALFVVTKDATRPFSVRTANGTVRVIGTIFGLRAHATANEEVTVLRGRVEVTAATAARTPVVLQAGDQARLYGGAPVVRTLTADELAQATAWRRGLIVFDAEPLRSALARVANYHGRTVEISPQLDGLTLGGSYDLTDMDAFLVAIEQVIPVHVLRGDRGRIRLVPR